MEEGDDFYTYDNPPEETRSLFVLLHSLSGRAWGTLLYTMFLVSWIFSVDWVLGLTYFVALAGATIPLLRWWRRHSQACPLDLLVRAFGMGFCLMFLSVNAILLIVILPIEGAIFKKAPLIYLLVMCASIVGVEELHRALLARWSKKDVAMGRETKAHQITYTSTSVGYATAATLTWLLGISFLLDSALEVKHDSLQDLGVALLALVCIVLFGVPLHVLSGYLIGLETTRQTPLLKAALYPFLFRTCFMWQILFWLVVLTHGEGKVTGQITRWFLFIGGMLATNGLICGCMLRRIKKVESSLPIEYLSRMGYLNAFGYGVLQGAEEEEELAGAVEIPVRINRIV